MSKTPETRLLENSDDGIAQAAELLQSGALVAFPTETVFGLGADARNADAVARIYEAKGRPSFNPLIIHVIDALAAQELVAWNGRADRLAAAFWPGALTLVLPAKPGGGIAALASAGLQTLAVRVPAAPAARAILWACGHPVAAPSANRSGKISPTTARHVVDGLGGRIEAVVDGPSCEVGLESTILDLTGDAPVLLRPGGIPVDVLEAALGEPISTPAAQSGPVTAPGQLSSHYAPAGTLRMNAAAAQPGETLLGFGPGPADINLSPSGDLREAAANLFSCLHAMDAQNVTRIAVAPIPETGLGVAINDRLRRAAAPRDQA